MPAEKLVETKENAVKCLERMLNRLSKGFNSDVAEEFLDLVHSIGYKKLMKKKEIEPYFSRCIHVLEAYIIKNGK